MLSGTKVCKKCGQEKPIKEFYRDKTTKDGYQAWCRDCRKQYCRVNIKRYREYSKRHRQKNGEQCNKVSKKWRKDNPELWKYTHKNSALKTNYGITLDEYNQMFIEQNGCCAICEKHQSEFKRALAVDHDHKTGEVRALLCLACNTKLHVFENKDFRKMAEKYLAKHENKGKKK